jgi:FkbM family methyltransferase
MFKKEEGAIAWLDAAIRPNDVFFDIGANIGVYTIFAAKRMAGGRVVAFEPHVANAASLMENAILNGVQDRVLLVSSALSDHDRYGVFNYVDQSASSSASQFGTSIANGQAFEPVFREVKNGCTIDTLCGNGILPIPSLVKIDIDGLECAVLTGMRNILTSRDRPRAVQVELAPDTRGLIGSFMRESGYVLRERHWNYSSRAMIDQGHDPEASLYNGIFCPADAP